MQDAAARITSADDTDFNHLYVQSADVTLHVATCGEGPLVLMIHGFPGVWYSWRHQLRALAAAGYKAAAIDLRGYGRSDRPLGVENYSSTRMEADLIAVLDHFGEERAFIVGQDFGSQYAWNLAVRRPDRVRAVVGMVPYDFDVAGRSCMGSSPTPEQLSANPLFDLRPPSERYASIAERHFIHVHYFQEEGRAERELAGVNAREFLMRDIWALSAGGDLMSMYNHPGHVSYLEALPAAPPLPWSWLSEAEFDAWASEFERGGEGMEFTGGLNCYRSADINWRIGEKWADARITPPALILIGSEDPVLTFLPEGALDRQKERMDDLRGCVIVEGAGHAVQQEKPEETTAALLDFFAEVEKSEATVA